MASSRARYLLSYTGLLLATVTLFAGLIWTERRAAAVADLASEGDQLADSLATTIGRAEGSNHRLTAVDTTKFGGPFARATLEMANLLDPEPGFFVIIGTQDQVLYESTAARFLPVAQPNTLQDSLLAIRDPREVDIPADTTGQKVERLLAVSRGGAGQMGSNISRIVFAIPLQEAEVPAQLLSEAIWIVVPTVLVLSLLAALFLARNEAKRVDTLVNEVDAISDGRSLHRRLLVDGGSGELARVSATLNTMLSRLEVSFGGLRRFTADASHELKTPLAVIRADIERAMHPKTARSERMVALEEGLHEVARMSDLVDSLLALARADEGRYEIDREPVHMAPLVYDVYETAALLGEDAGLAIVLSGVDDCVVLGDPTRLRQLLLNLLTNAIKYTPRGGRVEVVLAHRPLGEMILTVRDSGIGIAAADLPFVFDRFWRADRVRSRSARRGGFGLGLAISQWIAQAHGGTLTVQSRLGLGSVFTVTIPLYLPEGQAPVPTTDQELSPPVVTSSARAAPSVRIGDEITNS